MATHEIRIPEDILSDSCPIDRVVEAIRDCLSVEAAEEDGYRLHVPGKHLLVRLYHVDDMNTAAPCEDPDFKCPVGPEPGPGEA